MTTFRRFCCNDLLRLGQINLPSMTATGDMEYYMTLLGLWPGNCRVADAPGGRITGYVLGCAAGREENRTGHMSVIALRNKDLTDLAKKLKKLLQDCCEQIYNCYRMSSFAGDPGATYQCKKLRYTLEKLHGNMLEMVKPYHYYRYLPEI